MALFFECSRSILAGLDSQLRPGSANFARVPGATIRAAGFEASPWIESGDRLVHWAARSSCVIMRRRRGHVDLCLDCRVCCWGPVMALVARRDSGAPAEARRRRSFRRDAAISTDAGVARTARNSKAALADAVEFARVLPADGTIAAGGRPDFRLCGVSIRRKTARRRRAWCSSGSTRKNVVAAGGIQ